jgi:hypothetical protein
MMSHSMTSMSKNIVDVVVVLDGVVIVVIIVILQGRCFPTNKLLLSYY